MDSLGNILSGKTIAGWCFVSLNVGVQLFDGNWWGKKEQDVENDDLIKHLLERQVENQKEYMEDMKYEAEIEETYYK